MSCIAPTAPQPPLPLTPVGVSQEAKYLERRRGQAWQVESPDTRVKARVAETISKILQLHELEEDWDLDGARPIDLVTITVAAAFVFFIGQEVRQEGLSWHAPRVGPATDGSVVLTWERGPRQTMAVFRRSQFPLIVCVTRERDGDSTRQITTGEEAARLVFWTLSGA